MKRVVGWMWRTDNVIKEEDVTKFRDGLKAAARQWGLERAKFGDTHVEPKILYRYHQGGLAPEEQERVLHHLLFCRSCSEEILDFVKFLEFARQTPAAHELLSGEVDAAWKALSDLIRNSDPSIKDTE